MTIIYFILLCINLLLTYYVLKPSDKNRANWSFALTTIGITGWTITLFLLWELQTLFMSRLNFLFSTLIPCGLLIFIANYPNKSKYFTRPLITLLCIPTIIIGGLSLTDFVVTTLVSAEEKTYGIGHKVFIIYFLTYLALTLITAAAKIIKSHGIERKILVSFIISFFLSVTLAVTSNIFLPIIGLSKFNQLGPLFASIFIYTSIYSILKYRLMDIRIVISKPISIFFTGSLLISLYSYASWLNMTFLLVTNSTVLIIVKTVYLFVSGLSFNSLRVRLQSTAEKLFLKGQYDYKKALIKFSQELSDCTDTNTLIATIHKNFESEIEIQNVDIYLPDGFTERKEISDKLILQDQKIFTQDNAENKREVVTKAITRTNKKVKSIDDSSIIKEKLFESKRPIAFTKEKDEKLSNIFNDEKKKAVVPCFNTKEQLLCVLTLGEKMTQDPYSDDDIDLLTTLSTQIPPVLERIHQARVSAEMDVAQRIQVEILPKEPQIKRLELSCYMSPADEVGGDYYDVYEMENASWLVVGDVAGHGVGSGLVMFMVQSIMATLLQSQPDITPGELNYQANKILCKNFERLDEERPMTLVTLQTKDSRTFSISGSHDNIYIYRKATKEIEAISVDHFPFGIGLTGELDRELFMEETFTIETGDLLFLGTDGITEAFKDGDDKAEQYGEDRLTDIISTHHDRHVDEIRSALLEDLDTFSQGIYYDDVTFIIAKAV